MLDAFFGRAAREAKKARSIGTRTAAEAFRDVRADGLGGVAQLLGMQEARNGSDQAIDFESDEARAVENGEIAMNAHGLIVRPLEQRA